MEKAKIKQQEFNELHKQIHEQKEAKEEEKQPAEPWANEDVLQFNLKPITQSILLKGVTLRGKEKVPLSKITLMSLQ